MSFLPRAFLTLFLEVRRKRRPYTGCIPFFSASGRPPSDPGLGRPRTSRPTLLIIPTTSRISLALPKALQSAALASSPRLDVPLCVDLDGTLIRSDLLWESLADVLKRSPASALLVPFWLLQGKAHLKRSLAERTEIEPALLPYRDDFLGALRTEARSGRRLFLVTASDETLARKIADYLGIFEGVIASDGRHNLRGVHKRDALVARFGAKGFDYAADSAVDLPVWASARQAMVVAADIDLARRAGGVCAVEREFPRGGGRLRALWQQLRPHQWVKNLIVFIPLITSHQISHPATAILGLCAFAVFCLCASGVYVLNDLLDLPVDRKHATKRRRPLASGDLSLPVAFILGPFLILAGLIGAFAIGASFAAVAAVYIVISFAYSWRLKHVAMVDVFVLACLYTLRLVAGHVATGVEFSEWLLAFSMFLFLSLALVKRFQEVQRLGEGSVGIVAGRGYGAEDLEVLTPLGAASGYLSVLVLALYVNSEKVRLLYERPILLLMICPLLLYWISRVWLVAHRGNMYDDPVVFALKDRTSYLVGLLTLLVVWLAT